MADAFICDTARTPIGRYGGALASVRPDDLLAVAMRALKERNAHADWAALDDVVIGCANQAGEDNRDVARMSALLAGYGTTAPGTTLNRLCGSGLDAVAMAARSIRSGDAHMVVAGGVESMSRAPFVMGKANAAYSRNAEIFDTTIGWRFTNKLLEREFGAHSMPETAENVAEDYGVTRADQDAFALRSQQKASTAQSSGRFAKEIVPVSIPQRKKDPIVVDRDEHPRETTLETLAKLRPFVKPDGSGTITAGNASGVNDGAAALLIANEAAAAKYGLTPMARVVSCVTVGVPPRIMGIGPAPATEKLLAHTGLSIGDIDLIELNEAFASQGLAVMRQLGLADDAPHVNPNGGAIALGHPLGMSGARLAQTATIEMQDKGYKRAVCTMCIGVGQGIALLLEAV